MREYSIAAIPADGIGPEVIAAGCTVLASLEKRLGDVRFAIENFDWGSDYYKKHGVMMPSDGLERLKKFDAIYFGAVGTPDVPDHITLWGSDCRSARALTNMPMFGRPRSFRALPLRCATAASAILTG